MPPPPKKKKYYDSIVILDFSTPGSANPQSLRPESDEIFRVKKLQGVVLRGLFHFTFG